MTAIVMKAAAGGGGGIGDAAGQVVQVAQAASQIMDIFREQAAKAKEAARTADNEFNIRKNFLDNSVNAIKEATLSQFNIVICTDQERDDFQDLTGQILPMDLIDVEVAQNKTVNFQVYVFETGKYLRHGKYERDHWWWWGENKKFFDPAAMHVHFEVAQPKKNPDEIKKLQDENAASDKVAADAAAAGKASEDKAAADSAEQLEKEADKQAADAKAAAEKEAGIIPDGPDDEVEPEEEEESEDGYEVEDGIDETEEPEETEEDVVEVDEEEPQDEEEAEADADEEAEADEEETETAASGEDEEDQEVGEEEEAAENEDEEIEEQLKEEVEKESENELQEDAEEEDVVEDDAEAEEQVQTKPKRGSKK